MEQDLSEQPLTSDTPVFKISWSENDLQRVTYDFYKSARPKDPEELPSHTRILVVTVNDQIPLVKKLQKEETKTGWSPGALNLSLKSARTVTEERVMRCTKVDIVGESLQRIPPGGLRGVLEDLFYDFIMMYMNGITYQNITIGNVLFSTIPSTPAKSLGVPTMFRDSIQSIEEATAKLPNELHKRSIMKIVTRTKGYLERLEEIIEDSEDRLAYCGLIFGREPSPNWAVCFESKSIDDESQFETEEFDWDAYMQSPIHNLLSVIDVATFVITCYGAPKDIGRKRCTFNFMHTILEDPDLSIGPKDGIYYIWSQALDTWGSSYTVLMDSWKKELNAAKARSSECGKKLAYLPLLHLFVLRGTVEALDSFWYLKL